MEESRDTEKEEEEGGAGGKTAETRGAGRGNLSDQTRVSLR